MVMRGDRNPYNEASAKDDFTKFPELAIDLSGRFRKWGL